jgi:hypothetical protein
MAAELSQIEQVILTLDRATEANRNTPGRRGTLVSLSADMADEVLITGDLHGNQPNFARILAVARLDEHPRRHLILQEVCHGGPMYPDEAGCMSHLLLEQVAALKAQFPARVHLLLGNHELAELADFPIQKNRRMLNLLFRLGICRAYGAAAEDVRQAHWTFLRSCPLAVQLSTGVFISHSLPENVDSAPVDASLFTRELRFDDLEGHGAVFDLVWGRDYRLANAQAFAALMGAKVLIHGHQPCINGYEVPNSIQIILDCCGDQAAYLLLPLDRHLSHTEIVQRVRLLE